MDGNPYISPWVPAVFALIAIVAGVVTGDLVVALVGVGVVVAVGAALAVFPSRQ